MKPITSIDEVILTLGHIIDESKAANSPLGYFAALYQKVTAKVKEGIQNNYFDDGPRMEKLDIIFASRYLNAYYDYQDKKPVTSSWIKAFELSSDFWPTVLQHLLIGMNAHINLDLGIAAAEVSKGKNIEDLKGDFDKINQILSSLVGQVEAELAAIWPTLHWILRKTRRVDNFLVDFSMEIARDGAWRYARQIAGSLPENLPGLIKDRDVRVTRTASLITAPGWLASASLKVVRLGELGDVSQKIDRLATPA